MFGVYALYGVLVMLKLLSGIFGKSVAGHFIDKSNNTINEPKIGSILYTGLLADMAEHTGVYIGGGKIIELNNQGHIMEVTPSEFINGGTGINIYVSSLDNQPVGSSLIAQRAVEYEREVGVKEYNVLFDNCHMFTSACITGDLDNHYSFLWMVKDLAQKSLGSNQWLVWKSPSRFEKDVQRSPKPIEPKFTNEDLLDAQRSLQECRQQSRHFWNEIKENVKRRRKHSENSPSSWFFYSQSKADAWERELREIEEIENVNRRKHDDLDEEERALEKKIIEIETYLANQ